MREANRAIEIRAGIDDAVTMLGVVDEAMCPYCECPLKLDGDNQACPECHWEIHRDALTYHPGEKPVVRKPGEEPSFEGIGLPSQSVIEIGIDEITPILMLG